MSRAAVVAVAPPSHHPAARRRPQPAGSPQSSSSPRSWPRQAAPADSCGTLLCNFSSREHVWRALAAGGAAGPAQSDRSRFWSRSHPQLWSAHYRGHFLPVLQGVQIYTILCNTRIAILFGKITSFSADLAAVKSSTHYNSSYHK